MKVWRDDKREEGEVMDEMGEKRENQRLAGRTDGGILISDTMHRYVS